MFGNSKRLNEIERRLDALEKAVVAHEVVTDRKVYLSVWPFNGLETYAIDKFTIQEVVGALLNHLKLTLKKEHIYKRDIVVAVKEKKPKTVSTQRKDLQSNGQKKP